MKNSTSGSKVIGTAILFLAVLYGVFIHMPTIGYNVWTGTVPALSTPMRDLSAVIYITAIVAVVASGIHFIQTALDYKQERHDRRVQPNMREAIIVERAPERVVMVEKY